MFRTRLILALLAVVVLAGACGGDDSDQAERAPNERPSIAASDADQRDVERGTVAELAPVQLGDRFEWCADLQDALERNQDGLRAALVAVADYNDALIALSDAADELDRAEAIEQIDALEQRADDLIDAYNDRASSDTRPGLASSFHAEIRTLNAGAEGTRGVAYARAREAFEAAASPEESNLLGEFWAIFYLDSDEVATLRALALPASVQASIGVMDVRSLTENASVPDIFAEAPREPRDAVGAAVGADHYDLDIPQALAWAREADVKGHLLGDDYRAAAEALAAEASRYRTAVEFAYEAALDAYNAAHQAAAASLGAAPESEPEPAEEPEPEPAEEPAPEPADPYAAALAAAREIIDPYVTALDAAVQAFNNARAAAEGAASEEVRAAVSDLREESLAVRDDTYWELRGAVGSAIREVHAAAEAEFEAERDAARDAAAAAHDRNAPKAAAEALRVSRAEGLAAVVAAEAVLHRYELGDTTRDTVVQFLLQAVAVEPLLRSDAWAALERSLSNACQ